MSKNFCAHDILFQGNTCIDGLTKEHFHELLTITMPESLVLFDDEYYQQIDGVVINSLLYGLSPGSTLANVFLCYHEQVRLENCLLEFKLVVYIRYVDVILLVFRSRYHINNFLEYLNCQHPNIKFTF